MKKPLLNEEITKMRKMMGLNENEESQSGEFPVDIKRAIDEINDMFAQVKNSGEIPEDVYLDDLLDDFFVVLERPIEMKDNIVYIHGEKGPGNYYFKELYDINVKGDVDGGLIDLMDDLSLIKRVYKKVLEYTLTRTDRS